MTSRSRENRPGAMLVYSAALLKSSTKYGSYHSAVCCDRLFQAIYELTKKTKSWFSRRYFEGLSRLFEVPVFSKTIEFVIDINFHFWQVGLSVR